MNRKKSVLQSFYPNKLFSFASCIFFTGCSVILWESINNPKTYTSGVSFLWGSLPIEIQYLIFLSSILMSLLGLLLLFPNLIYVRITDEGIIHKSAITLFKEKTISWNLIDNFYIESQESVNNTQVKHVKIKFKRTYLPNFVEENILIPGNPDKVLKILRDYLAEYSEKDLN